MKQPASYKVETVQVPYAALMLQQVSAESTFLGANPGVSHFEARPLPEREHATPENDADLSTRWNTLVETLLDRGPIYIRVETTLLDQLAGLGSTSTRSLFPCLPYFSRSA